MSICILAAGWEDFLKLLPIVIGVLVWVISHFAGQVQPKMPPQRRPLGPPPQPGQPQPVKDQLQAEIDEFLRQAQAAREGRSSQSQRETKPQPGRAVETQRPRPMRRPASTQARQGARRDETRPGSRPLPPPVIEVVESPPARESVAQHVSESMDSGKFAKRAAQLSRMQEDSDAEFQKHMNRVFANDLGGLKPVPLGMFEAAGASAREATATADAAATVSAAGAQSAYAPATVRKQASNISLFLAGRKNIRDAIILNEILNRPEARW